MDFLKEEDRDIFDLIELEHKRQNEHIELIASENFVSKAVLEAQGSILTNKYAEGYPSKRYYGGCEFIDKIEDLARERLKKLFNVKYVNVQAHSGSSANMAAIRSLINHGDKILGMSLDAGGHLTHGYKLSFSGQDYQSFTYGVNEETGRIDYEEVRKIALEIKPNLIICGASAYPREIDFKKFKEIADECGAYLMADIAHIAGLIATGLHNSPVGYADVITSTTHKTLRGPRGGIIMCNDEELAKKIDRTLFPGCQGGPLEHIIAAKAVAFKEDLEPSYKVYMENVVKNAKSLADEFVKLGYKVISGGTDNHLLLIDVKTSKGVTGKEVEDLLQKVNITVNKNSIPGDKERPAYTSGIRLGTPAMTTKGYSEEDFRYVAHIIDEAINNKNDDDYLLKLKEEVIELNKKHPTF